MTAPLHDDALVAALRERAEALVLAVTKRALRGRDHVPSMRAEQDAVVELRAALAAHQAPAPADAGVGSDALWEERLKRLDFAIEGELDGLAITREQAVSILTFVDTGEDVVREETGHEG